MPQATKAITVKFVKFVQRKVVQGPRTGLHVGFLEGEMYCGVPTAMVVMNCYGEWRECFDFLMPDGSVVLAVPYCAVRIVED